MPPDDAASPPIHFETASITDAARSLTMTRTKLIRAAALTLLAAPMIASCAPGGTAQAGAAALSPKQAEQLDKQLAGKVPGERKRVVSGKRVLGRVDPRGRRIIKKKNNSAFGDDIIKINTNK